MQVALGRIGPVVVQMVLAILALAAVAFAPPAYGRMLLVPLDGRPVSRSEISELKATPLKPGPLSGSWIVEGDRELLSGRWGKRVLVLAAPAALCSSE